MHSFVENHKLILAEAAVVERVRRSPDLALDPLLMHAPLIYSSKGREGLAAIYMDYLNLAIESDLPIMLGTPTWRTNRERVNQWGETRDINGDAVNFLKELCPKACDKVKIIGLLGCKGDCYLPEQSLSSHEAEQFHAWQISRLANAGADLLMAVTLPALKEAKGMAKAMAEAGVPYMMSFVINRQGNLLDGTSLATAITSMDDELMTPPLGYSVNCAYPSFVNPEQLPANTLQRLIGIQANASSLDQELLEQSDQLKAEPTEDWADAVWQLHANYGLKVLGGCCGTGPDHLRAIVERAKRVTS